MVRRLSVVAVLAVAGCAGPHPAHRAAVTPPRTTATVTSHATPTLAPTAHPTLRSPRARLRAAQPAFSWSAAPVTTAELGKSWRPGCPVGASGLRNLRLTSWGFDGHAHTGTLVVAADRTAQFAAAFRALYAAHFPIRQMQPVAAYGGSDNRSMRADNTSAFNCRAAVANGPKTWSMHAFGDAVDIDPLENPYTLDGKVLPPQGAPYVDRGNVRPGMIVAGSTPVRVFLSLGWGWGGAWSGTPDYQHFSTNGR